MKKNVFKLVLLLSCLSVSITSCEDDSESISNNEEQIIELQENAISGDWRITNFRDSDENLTANFSDFVFDFQTTGIVTATNGTQTISGVFSIDVDDDDNDELEFTLQFSVPDSSDFDELNEDWDVVTFTDTRIELEDRDVDDIDILVFERN